MKVNYKIDLGLGSSVIESIESRHDLIDFYCAKGWKKFASHDDLMNVDVIDDITITVTASITLLCEEVVADGISSKEELKSEVTDLKRKLETLETTMIAKFEAFENNSAKKKVSLPCPSLRKICPGVRLPNLGEVRVCRGFVWEAIILQVLQ